MSKMPKPNGAQVVKGGVGFCFALVLGFVVGELWVEMPNSVTMALGVIIQWLIELFVPEKQ